jgi:hypothetical protein
MFRSEDLLRLVRDAGLTVIAEHDHVGRGHTLLHCRKSS